LQAELEALDIQKEREAAGARSRESEDLALAALMATSRRTETNGKTNGKTNGSPKRKASRPAQTQRGAAR